MTMLLRELIGKGEGALLRLYPEREARQMVLSLLESLLGTMRYTHIVEPGYLVSDEDSEKVLDAFERLSKGEPLQYVTGQAWFYGRCFNVTPDVLIPRPETEILCRTALEKAVTMEHAPQVLDLCTGSGCIAWTMALECSGSHVTAVDISDRALSVASSQDFSEELHASGATVPEFVKADVLAGSLPGISAKYDIILSNPPYVTDSEKALMRKNVLDYEPAIALFVPDEDPLRFYRAVAAHAAELLSENGFGIVEINEAFGQETAEVFRKAGFPYAEVMEDFSSRDRFVYFRKNP